MSSWAKPGVKCVCIRGDAVNSRGGWAPKTGGVYTIRGRYVGPLWDQVYLEEFLTDERHPDGCEVGWRADRFRPLVTKTQEQDLELFQHHLEGRRLTEPAA